MNITGVDKIRLLATDKKYNDQDRDPELNLIDVRYNGWRSATGFNWQRLAQPFGQDNPCSPVQNVNRLFFRRDRISYQSGAYVQSSRKYGSRLKLTLGGRVDNYPAIEKTRVSPRAGLSYRLTEKLSFRSSYGSYFQQPQLLFIEAFPQNKGVPPISGDARGHRLLVHLQPDDARHRGGLSENLQQLPGLDVVPFVFLGDCGRYVRGDRHPVALHERWPGTYDYPEIFNALGGYQLTKK